MDRLKGKRALVTGGSTGIGLETARQFVAEGARVAITARTAKSFEQARQELGDGVIFMTSDAADLPSQQQLAAKIKEELGNLDILFVNAGVAALKPIEQWDEAAFDRTFEINVRGPFFLIQALLPLFADPTSIVLNASINADIGMPAASVYAASKAALLSLARNSSVELAPRGIRVNAVSPARSRLRFTASSDSLRPISRTQPRHCKARFPPGASANRPRSQVLSYSSRRMNPRSPLAAN